MMLKKALIASLVAAAMSAGVAHATVFNIGALGDYSDTITHGVGSFEDTINFSISNASELTGSANFLLLFSKGKNTYNITGLTVNVWNNSHPNETINYGSFAGDNQDYTFALPGAGDYHVDITGMGTGTKGGTYAIALSAAPVPEPETYAMLLAGLGLMGGIARRRKQAKAA